MEFILIILIIVNIIGLIYLFNIIKNKIQINEDVKKQNAKMADYNAQLRQEQIQYENDLNALHNKYFEVKFECQDKIQNFSKTEKEWEEGIRKSFAKYCDILEDNYKAKEKEYQQLEDLLYENFNKQQDDVLEEINKCQEELDKIKATRAASIAAAVREEEIKQQLDFYCLQPKPADINDIQTLERIKPKLNNPRILSMLIWSTYFQKDMTALCNKILGTEQITGIYKITNQENNKCYIGQSVNVSNRWKDHAKHGLGIDTPVGNKLYKEMQEYGIWNFSWELLEKCPREQLDEKEKYYIALYSSNEFGYNSTKGNK